MKTASRTLVRCGCGVHAHASKAELKSRGWTSYTVGTARCPECSRPDNQVKFIVVDKDGRSEDGKKLGDDWVIANLGQTFDGKWVYLTTNGCPMPGALWSPEDTAAFLVRVVNKELRKQASDAKRERRVA